MNLRWNSSEYGGVKDLRIPPHRLWKPDVLMYNRWVSFSLLSTRTTWVVCESYVKHYLHLRWELFSLLKVPQAYRKCDLKSSSRHYRYECSGSIRMMTAVISMRCRFLTTQISCDKMSRQLPQVKSTTSYSSLMKIILNGASSTLIFVNILMDGTSASCAAHNLISLILEFSFITLGSASVGTIRITKIFNPWHSLLLFIMFALTLLILPKFSLFLSTALTKALMVHIRQMWSSATTARVCMCHQEFLNPHVKST